MPDTPPYIPFHHTCVGYSAPWWRPQMDCTVCRLQYTQPQWFKFRPQPRKEQSESGDLR